MCEYQHIMPTAEEAVDAAQYLADNGYHVYKSSNSDVYFVEKRSYKWDFEHGIPHELPQVFENCGYAQSVKLAVQAIRGGSLPWSDKTRL